MQQFQFLIKKIFYIGLFLILFLLWSCQSQTASNPIQDSIPLDIPNITVLGIAQDAGFPQANCKKSCCKAVWKGEVQREMVSCLAIVDPANQQAWLFDATPDFKDQLYLLQEMYPQVELSGIFLTHAHIGHYTGLMDLGREAMGAKAVNVYAMPRMREYLETNGPWSQLVKLENIQLQALAADSSINLSSTFKVSPFLVPHRDEYSETVGFRIETKEKSSLFIPDIDKWKKWDRDILAEIKNVDYAFLDGTFYRNGEIFGRDMSLIPHPFIEESLNLFAQLSEKDKKKVHFIHFNHTNPILQKNSSAYQNVLDQGFKIAATKSQNPL